MIVCSCYGVPCRRIKEEVSSGARTVKEVGLRCQAGRDCGGCRVQIHQMIKTLRAETGEVECACPKGKVGDKSAAA